jgi:hypothetical protein
VCTEIQLANAYRATEVNTSAALLPIYPSVFESWWPLELKFIWEFYYYAATSQKEKGKDKPDMHR